MAFIPLFPVQTFITFCFTGGNAYMKKLGEQWEELPPVFISSSEKKTGRTEILDYIDSINKELA